MASGVQVYAINLQGCRRSFVLQCKELPLNFVGVQILFDACMVSKLFDLNCLTLAWCLNFVGVQILRAWLLVFIVVKTGNFPPSLHSRPVNFYF